MATTWYTTPATHKALTLTKPFGYDQDNTSLLTTVTGETSDFTVGKTRSLCLAITVHSVATRVLFGPINENRLLAVNH